MRDINDGLNINQYGTKFWCKDHEWHRIGGPAIEWIDGYKSWYINGSPHRIDGPAIEYSAGNEWWLYGEHYTESEYNHLVSNIPLLYWNRFRTGEWI
jgi:hypothetical protein